jgi:hypothetical protein
VDANKAGKAHTDAGVPPCLSERSDLSSPVKEDIRAFRAVHFVSVKLHFKNGTQFARERNDSGLVILGCSGIE